LCAAVRDLEILFEPVQQFCILLAEAFILFLEAEESFYVIIPYIKLACDFGSHVHVRCLVELVVTEKHTQGYHLQKQEKQQVAEPGNK
jgi:hypothetical protein